MVYFNLQQVLVKLFLYWLQLFLGWMQKEKKILMNIKIIKFFIALKPILNLNKFLNKLNNQDTSQTQLY
jgi:hypothetical protein